MAKERIGFLGAGLMGHGMAKNIVMKGYPLMVMGHRNRKPIDDLVSRGATEGKSAAEIAGQSDIVFLCLPSHVEVERHCLGPGGIVEGAKPGLTVIDSTTVDPNEIGRIIEALKARGIHYVDAPLQRNPTHAEAGTLNIFVGTDPATLKRITPVLATFTETIFHIGAVGTAHRFKMVNNFLALGIGALVCETMAVAAKAGIDLDMVHKIIPQGGAQSSTFDRIMPWITGKGPSQQIFQLALAKKDIRCYTRMAESITAPVFMAQAIHQAYALADSMGYGNDLAASLAKALGKLNGVDLGPKEG